MQSLKTREINRKTLLEWLSKEIQESYSYWAADVQEGGNLEKPVHLSKLEECYWIIKNA